MIPPTEAIPPNATFQLRRLGIVMEPQVGNEMEAEGVLNPASARGRDGQLYLFPRLVALGNVSRIGIARVLFDAAGDPCGVERMGIAFQPEADYERLGCEDARITFIEPLQRYVMSYTALSPLGPRIAFAISEDLFKWRRLGLARFENFHGIDFVHVNNKDASFFPLAIPNHAGKLQMALLHRPLFKGTQPEETGCQGDCRVIDLDHESIWISYCPMPSDADAEQPIGLFNSHHRLATPAAAWEQRKIGGGTPPILTPQGWLFLYHGVGEGLNAKGSARVLTYSAGLMVLDEAHPHHVRYRSALPVLTPELYEEREGIVPNVVFPTAMDRRDDIGLPHRFDVYYGMADKRIGVARLDFEPAGVKTP